ncbi:RsmB/NOP family class I SAM-dependent RNA methyltransferase [Frigidibacter sp. RF13]|uniref:RsmB/NOP family class I SAM-dependent RNA methyltransferase n=1 Tax=Frigidibacter sp. RF13 TaxID=2997340 RepID=UPI00226FEFB0|nr:RsmB/NOP family class I SAM-dependent RNA methyltransferase [Frigidibacter sp. RF13]MCY1125692.1 RsmB/NOP family class I SAM-dependent RNA methyltransferase [Frigidibacter sp. RF13]
MTPAARVQTAIELLDRILAGEPAERALTLWARASRYAGSGDRAAVRDLVYDALRCQRSLAARAGAAEPTGRALMIALADPDARDALFADLPHGPSAIDDAERAALAAPAGKLRDAVRLDYPDWLDAPLRSTLGQAFDPVLAAMRERAPVFLRVNMARGTRANAMSLLAADGVECREAPTCRTTLEVVGKSNKINGSHAYLQGFVELQDLSSQSAVADLPLERGMKVLDYCAGGGGKALAMAARTGGRIDAHDANPGRMRDLPLRAKRAGADIRLVDSAALKPGAYDLVLVDAPCSGSGTWRRTPQSKWLLTPERLGELASLQKSILAMAAEYIRPGGTLAYMTCSLLGAENDAVVAGFLGAHDGFTLKHERRFLPTEGGDGFYLAVLARS